MKVVEFDKFQQELTALLEKYGVTTYLVALAIQDPERPNTDFPIMLDVQNPPGVTIYIPRLAAMFATFIQKALLQMVGGKCGLTVRQTRAVLSEMVDMSTELQQMEQYEAMRQTTQKAEA